MEEAVEGSWVTVKEVALADSLVAGHCGVEAPVSSELPALSATKIGEARKRDNASGINGFRTTKNGIDMPTIILDCT